MPRVDRLAALGILVVALWTGPALAAERTSTSVAIGDELRQELCLPCGVPLEPQIIAQGKDVRLTEAEARKNAPRILKFAACHVGGQRVFFTITFASKPTFENGGFLFYADLDCNRETGRDDSREHRGVDLMVSISAMAVSIGRFAPAFTKENTYLAGAKLVGNVLYLVVDAPLVTRDATVLLDLQLSSERRGGRSDSTRRQIVALPYRADRRVPPVANKGTPSLRPLSEYRYHDAWVKLEKLADKGLSARQVTPADPVKLGRPRPAPLFAMSMRKPGGRGSIKLERVPVEVLEEAGVRRNLAAASFGFPLPEGGVFDLENIRVLADSGAETGAQLTATAFWPDGSLKWVLVDFTAALGPNEGRRYTVEVGSDVQRQKDRSPLRVENRPERITVITGPLKVEIDTKRFQLFRGVWLDLNRDGRFDADEQVAASGPDGVRLVDEHGKQFGLAGRAPESVKIEEHGAQKVVVRVEGPYAASDGQPYMRYIARLVFRAGSPRVGLVYTHVNDYLKTEFTDIASLTMPLVAAGGILRTAIALDEGQAQPGQQLTLFQTDEAHCWLERDGQRATGGQSPGVARCETGRGALSAVVHDFWQRWPKGLSADGAELRIDLLPKQPGADFGRGLPHYLLYPFVEGFYRFKWGMSLTERVTFDFSGRAPLEEILAEARLPLVPVVPAAWYARTKALGPLAAPLGEQFSLWDKYAAASCRSYVAARAKDRAFGYFNYGDWYGERERNWGNNEYDFAHGYFMQFARTGNRDFFRLALTAARHEADVDCVHAYPDPYYVGANHLHSVGHTGMWSEVPTHGQWSWRYDYHTAAANGHTWADGMMDAWCLAGEAPIAESALALGEHIAWGMSRDFTKLGTHERSAGWSLKAIMAIYRGTSDPLYLEAARRIAAVALREQKFNDGGAWAHPLPGDHAGGHARAYGNAIFLIGVLLGGLKDYDEVVHDPAVEKSIVSGAEWLLKCWNEEEEGWPYTASASGAPYFPSRTSANPLACGPLAYAGRLTGDERFIRVAETGLLAVVRGGASASGKSIASQMNCTAGTLALLQEWCATHRRDKGIHVLAGSRDDAAAWLAKTHDAKEHAVRAPDRKVFVVRLTGQAAAEPAGVRLTATRRPFGAMTKRAEFGTIQVLDSTGAVIAKGQFSTDDSHEFTCLLKGPADSQFQVLIDDDQRGVWNLQGDRLQIAAQTVPGFCIGGVGRSRYHFFVPQGTREFQVNLRAGHNGMFAGLVLSPSNQIAGFVQGDNQPPADSSKNKAYHDHEGSIVVKPAPRDTAKTWSLVLTAGGDMYCQLKGVPPYLSLTADALPGVLEQR